MKIEQKIKKLKNFALLFTGSLLLLSSCQKEENNLEDTKLDAANANKTPISCIYGFAQSFASLDAIQEEHRTLFNAFQAAGGEEIVLENYEISKNNFYSLRKKDYEMTEGIIPDDPNFDAFNYTTDNVLETILNKDGMVIIDNFLYQWSDGAVIHRIPYSCSNYGKLLSYSDLVRYNPGNDIVIQNMKNMYKIEDIVIGSDPRFDFESISESGRKINNNETFPVKSQKSGCGLQTVLNQKLTAYDAVNKKLKYKLTASTAAPIGSNPISTIVFNNSSNYNAVTITASSNGYTGAWVSYVGDWVEVEVDFSNYTDINLAPDLNFSLTSVINLISANSCFAADELFLSIKCPLSLSKKIIDYSAGIFEFSIDGIQFFNTSGGYQIYWTFGDGQTQITTNTATVFHTYVIPCLESNYNVTATIKNITLCKNEFSLSNPFTLGDPCKRTRATNVKKYDLGGKKARLVEKIRPRATIFGGGTKLKNKFRCRILGTKNISASGPIFKAMGTSCVLTNVGTLLTPVSQNGKKRLKQTYSSTDIYAIDLNNPYSALFTHSNGFSQTLIYSDTCTE